ncbi:ATP-binding protein [Pseudomonas sp. NA-150]|uniref:ATP-binding protein n=1 Tax=Pseudomonas sp. NA-150 TaxID=3367525 RepID=UPI0037C519AE
MDLTLRGTLTQVLPIEDTSQVGHARRTAQRLAEQLGFDATDSGRVALVVTELTSNILKHAGRGELHLRALPRGAFQGLEVIAVDRGAGFDIHHCLSDGFSTRGTQGIGLGAVLRQADVFDVHADARGSVLLARFFQRADKAADYRFGVSQHSLQNDPACGDVWALAYSDQGISALIIDGLGHGEEAERAALAGAAAFAPIPFATPTLLLDDMHHAMRGTRGGALAFAQFDPHANHLQFMGIGNIGGSLIDSEKNRGLASHPGIVGLQFRKAQAFDYPQVNGQLLIMYSDGLQSRWNIRDYPGLGLRHPAVIAALLHRDYCRGRDDVTVLVIALETPNA